MKKCEGEFFRLNRPQAILQRGKILSEDCQERIRREGAVYV